MTATLFELGPADEQQPQRPTKASAGGTPRLRTPERQQIEMHWLALDELLEPEHSVRVVWLAVKALDLSPWLRSIEAVEGAPGRDATDPRLLLALWIYAVLDGVGSARRLARLCDPKSGPLAYRWLCGGVTLNYHTLSSFRSENANAWDELITQVVAALMHEGLVSLNRVAQDGMRVRANAGKSSFRRRPTLEECLRDAREQIETLAQLSEENPQELTAREQAARQRAAREREASVQKALENCDELQNKRDDRSKVSGEKAKEARASTTDPESRNMKFANGGYEPGYNVQYCTDTASGIIVGVDVTNAGSDAEQFLPMLEQLQERYDQTPAEALIDGGFATKEAIASAAERGCTVYAPVKEEEKQLAKGTNPFEKKRGDKPTVAQWRERMGTAAAKALYKLRAQTAEWVNAMARNRGFYRMPVRGQVKCRITAILYAITHNIVHGANLRAEAAMR